MSNERLSQLHQPSFDLGQHVGEIKAWCEAAATDAKGLSLSELFSPGDYPLLKPYMEQIARQSGVSFWLEKEFPATDLFGDMPEDQWVFVIFKHPQRLTEYLALKQDITDLVQSHRYTGASRTTVAFRLGKLLGYSDQALKCKLG